MTGDTQGNGRAADGRDAPGGGGPAGSGGGSPSTFRAAGSGIARRRLGGGILEIGRAHV